MTPLALTSLSDSYRATHHLSPFPALPPSLPTPRHPPVPRDHLDPRNEFQRAIRALGIAHLVAPSPQAKGKIERRFGIFQKHLIAFLAHAKVTA